MIRGPRERLPPLRMLVAFEALARLGNRAAAAAELNVTLGAIGKQLRALEQWLGTPLFEEDARDPPMTVAGRRLAQAVTAGMETIQIGIAEIAGPGAPVELLLLAPTSLAMRWLMPLLPRLEQALPELRMRIQATHTGEDWLARPHDAAIRRDGFLPPGYRSEPLFREDLAAFAAPELLDRCAPGAVPDGLPLLESNTRLGELDRWLAAAGVTKLGLPRQAFGHFYITYEAALAGRGLVVAPLLVAAADVAAGRLAVVRPDVIVRGAQVSLISREHDASAASLRDVAARLREEAGRAFGPGGLGRAVAGGDGA